MNSGTKAQRHEGTKEYDQALPACLHHRSAFSLTELLIVITLIVIVLALALPAFNFITGSKSTDAALNQISAMLGRARNEAVGVQDPRGVFFFLDPTTDKYAVALVQQAKFADFVTPTAANPYKRGDYVITGNNYWVCTQDGTTTPPSVGAQWAPTNQFAVDIINDTDVLKLPKGVAVQMITDSKLITGNRTSDAYLRVGALMFDSAGRLSQQQISVCCGGLLGQMMNLAPSGSYTVASNYPFATVPAATQAVLSNVKSCFGFVLFDREMLKTQAFFTENDYSAKYPNVTPQLGSYGTPTTGEGAEEDWIDKNAVPVLINRYNGTLLRGE
jgi:prepilin-type N-terminal cleavage/methylation domain-containing protein